MRKMSNARRIAKFTTQVKNTLKKLDQKAYEFNTLSQHIYDTSLTYYTASQTLEALGGPPPQWYLHGNQSNSPLNFSFIFKECWGCCFGSHRRGQSPCCGTSSAIIADSSSSTATSGGASQQ